MIDQELQACFETPPALRGAKIPATMRHDAGAYARCHYCRRYSDDPKALGDRPFACDCGNSGGWSGSSESPNSESQWSTKEKSE